jgi:hypothetical protein
LVAELEDLEIARGHGAESRIYDVVVPARIVGPRHIHIRPVVSDDQPVLLHGAEDPLHARVFGALRWIDRRLETQASAHGESASPRAGAMGRRVDVTVSSPHGHSEGMPNLRPGWIVNFIKANQAWQDGQSGGVG